MDLTLLNPAHSDARGPDACAPPRRWVYQMEENPGPGLDKTLLGVLAPGSHHVLAERFDMTKIGAGPKVRSPGRAGAPGGVRQGAAPAFPALRWLRFVG